MIMNNSQTKASNAAYPIAIISLCACFLFYKYILQVYPSVITDQLMREFQLTGAGLGNLAATFYYTYMVTQLFVGLLLDKYSARWLTSIAIFACALGIFLFAQVHTTLAASLARGLMGMGVAFATVAYMKFAAMWFAPRHYAFISGLLATAAMSGAVFGQAPLSWWVNSMGWRHCLSLVGIIGFVVAALFFCIVRDASTTTLEPNVYKKSYIAYKDIWQIFKNPQNWLLTLYSGLAFSPVAVFGGLWGNPFLEQAYHLNKTEAASLVSLVFIGLGLGSPLLGLLSSRLRNRRYLMFFSTFTSFLAILLILYVHAMPLWLLSLLLFIFGAGLGAFMLVFTIAKELNSASLTATVIAMVNTSDAVLDAITEPSIGKLLDYTWDGTLVNGIPYFSLHSYYIGLSVLPLYLFLACILLIWIKENPRSV